MVYTILFKCLEFICLFICLKSKWSSQIANIQRSITVHIVIDSFVLSSFATNIAFAQMLSLSEAANYMQNLHFWKNTTFWYHSQEFNSEKPQRNSFYWTQNISFTRIWKSSKDGVVNKIFSDSEKIPPWGYPNSLFNGASYSCGRPLTDSFNPNQRISKMGMSSWENIKNHHLDEKRPAYGKRSILN